MAHLFLIVVVVITIQRMFWKWRVEKLKSSERRTQTQTAEQTPRVAEGYKYVSSWLDKHLRLNNVIKIQEVWKQPTREKKVLFVPLTDIPMTL